MNTGNQDVKRLKIVRKFDLCYHTLMKEKEFLDIIKSYLNSGYIGDDCAYLRDLEIVITQDSLVEDVHFKMEYTDAYKLGYKSAMVNISDICASGAEPAYMTVALSLPANTQNEFIKDFYRGLKDAAENVIIAGGDITGSEKLFISITVIGKTAGRTISSRAHAQVGQLVIVSGEHGNSAEGLKKLLKNETCPEKFLNAHLMPEAERKLSRQIAENIKEPYAMMDTSDGLADALSQIANSSGVKLTVEYDKIPHDARVTKENALYGGEDYKLVATVPESLLPQLEGAFVIGKVEKGLGVELDGILFTEKDINEKIFNHFGGII